MQPDDRDLNLERELSAAGSEARRSDARRSDARPDAVFAAGLREELLAELPERPPVVRWAFHPRMPGFAPLAAAAVLIVVGAVTAREIYVAVGDRPSQTPVSSMAPSFFEPSASVEPSFTPTDQPSSEATSSVSPSAAESTPEPTVKPTPEPTPTLGALSLAATACPGGVVLDWSTYEAAGFDHYLTLRNTSSSIPLHYPPQGGAVDPGGTYSPAVSKTSAVDAVGDGMSAGVTYYYRTMAFSGDGGVVAASSVASAAAKPVRSLGALSVSTIADGTKLSWTPFGGSGACFTWYKLVYSEENPSPSYLGGDPYLTALGEQGASSFVAPTSDGPDGLVSGHTYYLRVQVIRAAEMGGFLVAQTSVTTFTVP